MLPWVLAVLASYHFEGDVTADGGDYLVIPFEVPADTVEIRIAHADGAEDDILDWGVWEPRGWRGWPGGLTDDAIIGVDESSRGYMEGPIAPGTWQLVIGKAKLGGGSAHYVVDVTCHDVATLTPLPRAAWQPVIARAEPGWYAGDFHVHSEESGDATATLDMIAQLSRERGLDFVALSDHNTVSHHGRIAAFQPSVPDLLFLRAIEVTTYGGHGNALGVASYVDHRVGLGGVSAGTITADIAAQGGAFLVNHPTLDLGEACIGCKWDHADLPWGEVAGLEILTGPYEVVVNLFTPTALALWDTQLDAGHHIAAIGGSDDHRAGTATGTIPAEIGSPTTMVYATELSEAGIIAGVRGGRTIVKLRGPDDPFVELTMARADGSAAMIGDTVTGVDELAVTVHVVGGDGMDVTIWRDGVNSDSLAVVGADWTEVVRYPAKGGPERLRAELEQGGQRIAVTSHIYVDGSAPSGGCCDGGRGNASGAAVLIALVGLVMLVSPRRRARAGGARR